MNTRPSISISMATYNGEAYLREQLDSLAAQTLLPIELQIGDDGSTDRTEQIVRDFAAVAPFPVIFYRNERNLGYGENFLRTASRCSGDWIAFCDQDDIWLSDRLRLYGQAIAAGPCDLTLVVSDAYLADKAGLPSDRTLYRWKSGVYPPGSLHTNFYCHGFMQVFSARLIRDIPFDRRVVGSNNPDPLPPNFTREPHEAWIGLLATSLGSVAILKNVTAWHRRHGSTVTYRPDAPDQMVGMSRKSVLAHNYRQLATWNDHAADRLSDVIGRSKPGVRTRLEKSAARCSFEARRLTARAKLYSETSVSRAMGMLVTAVRGGFYRGKSGLRIGSLLKDVALNLLPRVTGRQ